MKAWHRIPHLGARPTLACDGMHAQDCQSVLLACRLRGGLPEELLRLAAVTPRLHSHCMVTFCKFKRDWSETMSNGGRVMNLTQCPKTSSASLRCPCACTQDLRWSPGDASMRTRRSRIAMYMQLQMHAFASSTAKNARAAMQGTLNVQAVRQGTLLQALHRTQPQQARSTPASFASLL